MRQFEMYLVFILSATLLSVRGNIDIKIFRVTLLNLHNEERSSPNLPKLKLVDTSYEIVHSVKVHIKDNLEDNIHCFEDNICFIYAKIENYLQKTVQKMMDIIQDVHGTNESHVRIVDELRQRATYMDFILFNLKYEDKENELWFVTLYYPKDFSDVFASDEIFTDIELLKNTWLKIQNKRRSILNFVNFKLLNTSYEIVHSVKVHIKDNLEDNIHCFEDNICFIYAKIENYLQKTVREMMDIIQDVHGTNESHVRIVDELRQQATYMDFILFNLKYEDKENELWFVTLYYPESFSDVFGSDEEIFTGDLTIPDLIKIGDFVQII